MAKWAILWVEAQFSTVSFLGLHASQPGGHVGVGLLVTDPAPPRVRPTQDIAIIVEVNTRAEYDHRIREALLARGLKELFGENIPTCAWEKGEIRRHIMPTDERLLGFSNWWYEATVEHAEWVPLTEIGHKARFRICVRRQQALK